MQYLKELHSCKLCEWKCGVDRLSGETGVCRMTVPEVASAQLHPAPPQSYTIFTAGCNFKCINCQNWSIAHYPDNLTLVRGFEDPKEIASESVKKLQSPHAKLIGADRIFFSGGEPTIHLPYVEKIVEEARKLDPKTKVNFDTNGFMTESSLRRIINLTTSITFDIKAFSDEVHRAVTGAPSEPVLRNAERIARYAKEKLWEFRILVLPGINDEDIEEITDFIASIDPSLKVCFLAFRPNFVLENYPGASRKVMERCVMIARKSGLEKSYWSGHTDISGEVSEKEKEGYKRRGARVAGFLASSAGCILHPRLCGKCKMKEECKLKGYTPRKIT